MLTGQWSWYESDCALNRQHLLSILLPLLANPPGCTTTPAARACKNDAVKFCNVTWFFGYKAGQVISCLREFKNQVGKNCKKELFKAQKNVGGAVKVAAVT